MRVESTSSNLEEHVMRAFTVLLTALLTLATPCAGQDKAGAKKTRILLIGKDRDQPYGTHEYMTDCRILARCLEETPGVEAIVSNGWPADPAELKGVKGIVLYTAMGGNVLLSPRTRPQAEALLEQGAGLTAIHWATAASRPLGKDFLRTLGGWFHQDFSRMAIRSAKVRPADPGHPIARGWKEFDLRDEYYLDLKFEPAARPVVKATLDRKDYTMGWVYVRPHAKGGRSFGCVCGHFHVTFGDANFRKILVNGILWTMYRDIPAQGAPVEITAKDMVLPPLKNTKVHQAPR
jgi:type 1 glutamine amidotransferase